MLQLQVSGRSVKSQQERQRFQINIASSQQEYPIQNHNESSATDVGFQLISPKNSHTPFERLQPSVQHFKAFDFTVPFTTYPMESFQPTLPQRCFISNPLYTFSRFKRQLLGSNTDLSASLLAARSSSRMTSRQTSRSTRRATPQSRNYGSETLNLIEHTSHFGELHFEDPEPAGKSLIVLAKTGNFFKSRRRVKSAYQGPNFPFNLNYMLTNLKSKGVTPKSNVSFQSRPPKEHLRPFTSNVYKRRANSPSRQFYTECLRISNHNTGFESNTISLKPSTTQHIDSGEPRLVIRNKEVSILQNIFTRHKPSQQHKIALSELQ